MAYTSLTDVQLINLLASDDEEAFEEIFKRYIHPLAAFTGSRIYNLEDARDILHDLFVQLWEDRRDLVMTSRLETYLFTIARHHVIDRIRRNTGQKHYAKTIQSLAEELQVGAGKKLDRKELQKKADRLLEKFSRDEAAAEEMVQLYMWVDGIGFENSGWQQLGEAAKEAWNAGLLTQVKDSIAGRTSTTGKKRSRKYLWWGVAVAAAITVIAFLSRQLSSSIPGQADHSPMTSLSVSVGQIKRIFIADSSKAWLNEKSELQYPAQPARGRNDVYLSGEAYFDIAQNPSKYVVVHAGKLVINGQGSSFNVKEDKILQTIIITVAQGKLSVSNGSNGLGVLNQGQQLRFNSLSNGSVRAAANAEQVISWKQNALSFDNTTLEEIAAVLERRFEMQIIFDNEKLMNCRFTGSFAKNEKLDDVLQNICNASKAHYQRQADSTVVITGAGCEGPQRPAKLPSHR